LTAIIFHRHDDGIAVYTDGAAYDDDGVYRQPSQKADILMHAPAVVAMRGTGSMILAVGTFIADCASFDDVLGKLGTIVGGVAAMASGHAVLNLAVCLGGWSEQRQAWEAYRMWCAGRSISDLEPGTLQLDPIDGFWAEPWPETEHLAALGLMRDDGRFELDGDDEGFVRFMEAQRRTEDLIHPEWVSGAKGCTVGGFIQKTVLARDEAWTGIIHRWPDRIGEPLGGANSQESGREFVRLP